MPHSVPELRALIRACEQSAEQHIVYAKRAHTPFQRQFHERRASDDLLRAARHRDELQGLVAAAPRDVAGGQLGPDAARSNGA